VGFGFNDNHLAEPVMSAIRSNLSMKIVVVSPGLAPWDNGVANGPGECQNNKYLGQLKSLTQYLRTSHNLGYAPGADNGPLLIEVPRDRAGSFEPLLVPKHVLRFTGFEDKIMAMNARGMTMREAAI
jgi:hypothetical protein